MRSELDPGPGNVQYGAADRRTRVIADLCVRLEKVCQHLSETEFGQLIEEMADRQLRGERRASFSFPVSKASNVD